MAEMDYATAIRTRTIWADHEGFYADILEENAAELGPGEVYEHDRWWRSA
jgi:hypothetical protein